MRTIRLSPARPEVTLAGEFGFRPGRVHEICGRARRTGAALLAGAMEGPVIWALPLHAPEQPFPAGLAPFLDPGRLVLVRARTGAELLWVIEEALRSGAVRLAVAELAEPPGLTPVRRLHLAAEAGGGRAIGLLLTPEGGAPGVESRWRMVPDPEGGWTVERLRARMAPVVKLGLRMGPGGLAGRRLGGPPEEGGLCPPHPPGYFHQGKDGKGRAMLGHEGG